MHVLLPPAYNLGVKHVCPSCSVPSDMLVKGSSRTIIDEEGNPALHCSRASSGARTSAWHDPMVSVLASVLKVAGLKVRMEQSNVFILGPPGARADLISQSPGDSFSHVIDVRTVDPCASESCRKAARYPGSAADGGERLKNSKWRGLVHAQGDVFVPFVIEAGGRFGNAALDFLHAASTNIGSSPSERAAFMTYALQRLHLTSQHGVAPSWQMHLSRLALAYFICAVPWTWQNQLLAPLPCLSRSRQLAFLPPPML